MDFEIDERMSAETIQFLYGAIESIKQQQNLDLNTIRKIKIESLLETSKSIEFTNIKETQHSITNKDDNHLISFSCYRPDNCRENAPITLFIHGGKYHIIY
jgi:hypothetical protein